MNLHDNGHFGAQTEIERAQHTVNSFIDSFNSHTALYLFHTNCYCSSDIFYRQYRSIIVIHTCFKYHPQKMRIKGEQWHEWSAMCHSNFSSGIPRPTGARRLYITHGDQKILIKRINRRKEEKPVLILPHCIR